MKLDLVVIGSPTHGTIPSVMLVSEKCRYLFNAGSGIQRFCVEHKLRLSKTTHLLMSETTPECLGGAAGLMLSLADSGRLDFNMYGAPGLIDTLYAVKPFFKCPQASVSVFDIKRPEVAIEAPDFSIEPILCCGEAHVTALPPSLPVARPPTPDVPSKKKQRTAAPALPPAPKFPAPRLFIKFHPRFHAATPSGTPLPSPVPPAPGRIIAPSEPPAAPHPVVSYMCTVPIVPGRFHPDKAKALGVPPGRLFGQLSKNMPVTLDDGTVVTPEQVKDPDTPGQVVGVVACPTLAHVDGVVAHPAWAKFIGADAALVVCLVHLGPRGVVLDGKYQAFMARFPDGVQHIFASSAAEWGHTEWPLIPTHQARVPLRVSAAFNSMLHMALPTVFPVPASLVAPPTNLRAIDIPEVLEAVPPPPPPPPVSKKNKAPAASKKRFDLPPNPGFVTSDVVLAAPKLTYCIEPKRSRGLTKDHVVPCLQPTVDMGTLLAANPEVLPLVDAARLGLASPTPPGDDTPPSFPPGFRLVFLGTGAAVPAACRNVSAVFVKLSSAGSMLFDCGENTWHQMCRAFGLGDAPTASATPSEDVRPMSSWAFEGSDRETQPSGEPQERLFPSAQHALRDVKLVWISHRHADHLLGLPRLIKERSKLVDDVLVIVGPPSIAEWLLGASVQFPSLRRAYQFWPCTLLWTRGTSGTPLVVTAAAEEVMRARKEAPPPPVPPPSTDPAKPGVASGKKGGMRVAWKASPPADSPQQAHHRQALQQLLAKTVGVSLEATAVDHCFEAFGVRVNTLDPPCSIVYSGDTRPSAALVELGKGCDLLIHEATFDNDAVEDAIDKWHVTVEEAVWVANAMGAKNAVLTHFSARYPKMPPLDPASHIGVAFDLMHLGPVDFGKLTSLNPVLSAMYPTEEEEEEEEEEGGAAAAAGAGGAE